ncbi:MAG: hypothetical protein A2020_11265 [Lentisphaerae bacterium GWF2_45_14]|nr:MAG: hypothetical protein A2020_11265 [Lentisphaerae bacterium GWF2_45_14]
MNLWKENAKPLHSNDDFFPYLEFYPVKTAKPVGAVMVCPGGGYAHRAPHEGETIAEEFNKQGIHAFVLHYRVAPNRNPAPLDDARRGMRLIRSMASKFNVKADKIAVCGFSAGGHLAGSLGIHFDKSNYPAIDSIDKLSCRPDAMILCYPVISSGEYRHDGSFKNLLGSEPDSTLMEHFSLENHAVSGVTPPAFMWHTSEDTAVPVENSLLLASALSRNHIPFELHIYEKGRHGLGLCPEDSHVASWFRTCTEWLVSMGWKD